MVKEGVEVIAPESRPIMLRKFIFKIFLQMKATIPSEKINPKSAMSTGIKPCVWSDSTRYFPAFVPMAAIKMSCPSVFKSVVECGERFHTIGPTRPSLPSMSAVIRIPPTKLSLMTPTLGIVKGMLPKMIPKRLPKRWVKSLPLGILKGHFQWVWWLFRCKFQGLQHRVYRQVVR